MLDLPGSAVIVGGLEGWKYAEGQKIPIIDEPRLVDKLRAITGIESISLRRPPCGRLGFGPA